MTEFAEHTAMTAVLVVCGTVLLISDVSLGRDLITLAVGIEFGSQAK